MNTAIDCLPCFVRQTLDACRIYTDDPALHEQLVRDILHWMSEMELSLSPPALAQQMHRRLRERTGLADPYRKQKDQHNQMALSLLPELRKKVETSHDPLISAVQLAIAGNVIDLGAKSGLSDGDIHEAILHAADHPLDGDLELFRQEASSAKNILYLTDNCGEIVFDTLLIEQLGAHRITVAVRGKPVINDATREDAVTAGLDRIVPILENGSDAPGAVLEDCSAEFRQAFDSAEMIVSKGQGNFETLNQCGRTVFFLLKVKCLVVAKAIQYPTGSHVLRKLRT